MSEPRIDLPAVSMRFIAVPVGLLPLSHQRAPCSACAYVAPAERCHVMRSQVVAWGLPDCSGDFVYREVTCD